MSFRFKNASSVVVGTFNIYIVQPNWLSQVGILAEGSEYEMQADLDRPGFRFRPKDSPHSWQVRPDRITIETESNEVDCGGPLARVLETLQWTPVMGVGTNLQFEADVDELGRLKYQCPSIQPPEGLTIGQSTWHVAFVRGAQTFNFQVAVKPSTDSQKLALSMNVHTEIKRELKQLEANALATQACRDFVANCKEVVQLSSDLLGVEISQ